MPLTTTLVLGAVGTADGSSFNAALRTHACAHPDWRLRELAHILYTWAERFDAHFGLNVTAPAIAVDTIRALGHYRSVPNGFGIDDEVVIANRTLARPFHDVLAVLLHEMLHQWQHHHGRPARGNYHNTELRAKCTELGIPTNTRGYFLGIVADSPFGRLLREHGITANSYLQLTSALAAARPGSRLKKWRCRCTIVRCAVELHANCEHCHTPFELASR